MKMKLNIQMFASTNKTANYNLSQYVGSDKPTYLGDYNSDMAKIDAQMKANADAINETDTKAELAKTTADTALQNATSAGQTATTANNTATSALNKALQNESNINKFNFTNFKTYNASEISISKGSISDSNLTIARNSEGSIAKIYGQITNSFTNDNGLVTLTLNSDLRPTNNIFIGGLGIITYFTNQDISNVYSQGLTIKTDGTIEIAINIDISTTAVRFMFSPAILIMEDFGDQA